MITESTTLALDGTTPAAAGLLVEKDHELILQQGGYASLMPYTKVEFMDLAHFLQYEVPKLQDELKTGEELRLLRSLNNDYVLAMFRDYVVKYHLTDIVDIPLHLVEDKLKSNSAEINLVFDIPYRLISYKKTKSRYSIIVYLPSERVPYKTHLSGLDVSVPVWMPPVWFKVEMSFAYQVENAYVAVALEQASDVKSTVLRRWPLPNVFPSTLICFGSSTIQAEKVGVPGIGLAVKQIKEQFYGSSWNKDLLQDYPSKFNRKLEQICSGLPKVPQIEDIDPAGLDSTDRYLRYMLRVLYDPMGYMRFPWNDMETIATSSFLEISR